MLDQLLNQYKIISNEIELEKQTNMDKLISVLASIVCSEKDSLGIVKETVNEKQSSVKQYEKNMLSLQCIRIGISCQLINKGHEDIQKQLKQDISDAIENVRRIEYAWELNDAVVGDAIDLMVGVCPTCKDTIIESLGARFHLTDRRGMKVTQDLYSLYNSVADYYEQHGKEELAFTTLEYLCQISRERNSLMLHRELISRILFRIGEKAPEIGYKIAHADIDLFINDIDEYSGDFFWFYGCFLQKLEKLEEAEFYFKKCYNIRNTVHGEDSWYTALAKREYLMMSSLCAADKSGREYFIQFIDNIENGLYEEIDEELLAIVEGRTLYIVLRDQSDIGDLAEYNSYLCMYERICSKYNETLEPMIKIYLAKNLRGGYYLKLGDYIQAESAFLDAISAKVPENISPLLTEEQIKSNLLMIYYVENDLKMAIPLLFELLDVIECDEYEKRIPEKDVYRIYTIMIGMEMQTMTDFERDDEVKLKSTLLDTCQRMQGNPTDQSENSRESIAFMLCAIMRLLQNESVEKNEQLLYLNTLGQIMKNAGVFLLNKMQKVLLYFISGILVWNLDLPNAEIYFKECLKSSNNSNVPILTRISILQTAAAYYGKTGKF